MRAVYIVGSDAGVTKMFTHRGWLLAETDQDADAVIFTGGADITPFLYGERIIQGTQVNFTRDLEEVRLFKSLSSTLPKIGICRGGQFLNVMSGGSMFQDVDNHAIRGCHDMKDVVDGNTIMVTSTHHQMMIPSDKAFIIGLAKEASKKVGERISISIKEKTWDDHEVLYYEHNNAFCFQPHPEYVKADHDCQEYFFRQIEAYCF